MHEELERKLKAQTITEAAFGRGKGEPRSKFSPLPQFWGSDSRRNGVEACRVAKQGFFNNYNRWPHLPATGK